jgi:chromosome segregation ATPase
MPRPSPQSPERAQLAAAHTELAAAQAAVARAEDEHRQALRAHNDARGGIDDIAARISELDGRRHYGVWQLRAETNAELEKSYMALEIAKRDSYPLAVAEEQARQQIAEAQRPIFGTQRRLTEAAAAVAQAEALPIAREHLARCREALATLLEHAPHLLVMADKNLLPANLAHEVVNVAGSLLTKGRDWPEFEGRYHTSPWRAAIELLKQDPLAALPSVTS